MWRTHGQGRVKDQGHKVGPTTSHLESPAHIPFVPCQSALPFLRYGYFIIWPWKSKVKVLGEVKVQRGSDFLLTHIWLVSCQPASPLQGYSFFKSWPWKPKVEIITQGSNSGSHILLTHIPFMLIDPPIPEIQLLQNFTLKIQVQVHDWGQSPRHKVRPASNQFTSLFYPHSRGTAFLNLTLTNQVKVTTQGHIVGSTSYWLTSLWFYVNRPSYFLYI